MSPTRTAAVSAAVLAMTLTSCTSSTIVTQGTLAPVDRPFVGTTAPLSTGTSAVTTPAGATVTGASSVAIAPTAVATVPGAANVPGAATIAGTVAPTVLGSGPLTAITFVTLAAGQGPSPTIAAPTTAPPTTVPSTSAAVTTAAPIAATPPASVSPPVAAVGAVTCIPQSFGRGIDADSIKLVEKALHATQNGDFDKLMLDLNQWVANSKTILEQKWRSEGFDPKTDQVSFLTFYALGIACPNYTFLPGERTLAAAPYKPPVGNCLDHTVALDASTGGVFPNNDIKVVQQALYELNVYFSGIGGTPGTKTMAALYKAIGGGFSTDNPLHELSLAQLGQLQIAC